MKQTNSMNDINKLGKEGELWAYKILDSWKYEIIQSPDWLAYNLERQEWVCVEAKRKERFKPPPFEGHGLNIRQVKLRNGLLEHSGIRTILMIFEIPTENIYFAFLDELENGEFFDTRNGVRVYPLKNFKELV